MIQWHDLSRSLHEEPRQVLAKVQSIGRSAVEESSKNVGSLLSRRSPSSTSSSSGSQWTCGANANSKCAYDTAATNETLPIVLGVVIPLIFALGVFAYLHRRNRKKQDREDAEDKHASLDFGLGEVHRDEKEKNQLQESEVVMSDTNIARMMRSRGVSVDLGSPYVLPPSLHDSRGSLHSLSRSQDGEGPYRSVHLVQSSESLQALSPTWHSRPTSQKDASSVKTRSTDSTSRANLLHHAQKPSKDYPPISSAPTTPPSSSPPTSSPLSKVEPAFIAKPEPVVIATPKPTKTNAVVRKPSPPPVEPSPRFVREGTDQQGAFVPPPRKDSRPKSPRLIIPQSPPPTFTNAPQTLPQESRQSHAPSNGRQSGRSSRGPTSPIVSQDDTVTYADVLGIVQKESKTSPVIESTSQFSKLPTIPEPTSGGAGLGVKLGSKRLQAGQRPLPPNDPSDTPEQRANKIRSFYREYFDESKGHNSPYIHGDDYYEGYSQEYLDGAAIWDPESGQFIVAGAPFHSPVTRRAMTPPPRAPPRFRNSPVPSGRRSLSSTRYPPSGRAYSTASAQPVGYRGRTPKRRGPSPGPLTTLPTPYLLRDDSALLSPIEFAPPMSYKDRQAGRHASPRAEQMSYAPSVRAFTPLVSAFDDLTVIPSPHALRKSGSFTGLDFAPAHRFKFGEGGGSDAGSVRSGRSNISAAQLANIRAGAYRLSRVPREAVGTRDDFAVSLKPQWDLSR